MNGLKSLKETCIKEVLKKIKYQLNVKKPKLKIERLYELKIRKIKFIRM